LLYIISPIPDTMSVSAITRSYKSVGEKLRSDLSNWYEWSDQMKEYLVLNGAERYISSDIDIRQPTGVKETAVFDRSVSTTYGMIKQWLDHEVIDKYLKDSDGCEEQCTAKAWKKLKDAYNIANKL
jgi:hypothetical protein